ncbi:lipid IV(A) 3-deoxy-D-manno-octulosonic acid transferase [Cupriavidus metallidurans]|uniref:3-deoxy-D-manno-octulosonic acid transferase n=1 Tax=Cupriavidus metallidurans (strain ATCC 43123 / DSM 2839 / NBRC 102507 / CH34) TaxID=266264 RepID=Q1LJT9_CUPMC|nr:lipid IV(A) 3-deoxy-D-manno-octulosonic acid transferase [Cupriavidus metallidurans]ABF09587.1 3-deoxy-D-manno-octulosonic-acid transferase (KDO transferase) [Cupriavidus metallidurans CH34]QGS29563.1 3-deoxy-D-manno-octulosonic acid transferase [Cupriavidus metallidurans]
MLRFVYSLLWLLILPLALLRLVWRSRKESGYIQHVGERLGRYGDLSAAGPWLWVHAVSVGETRAAQPLIDALLAAYPRHRLLLTHMTPTGRQTGAQLYGANPRVQQCYLPYDLPWLVRRFLAYFQPDAGLIMETEVWPNLVHVTRRMGVPLFLVNARLSPRSYRRTARFGGAAAALYNDFTMVLAQTAGDAERYRALGVKSVQVTGNLKFDMQPPEAGVARGQLLRQAFGNRHVLAAASTREGEEPLILEAFSRWPGTDRPALLLVPRHPQRFDEVAAMATRAGFSVQRRSALDIEQLSAPITADVVLGDSMGEMAMYYAASDIAYIGGSLIPLGGQNLIEACAVGTPVLMGPHTFNFAQATEDAIAAGACQRVADADELMVAAAAILGDATRLADMREHALTFAGLHRGATARTLGALAPVLR